MIDDIHIPTQEEIRTLEEEARRMRALALRDAVRGLYRRLSALAHGVPQKGKRAAHI